MTSLVLADHDNASLKDSTAKAVSAAHLLGGDVHVLVAGLTCVAAAEGAAPRLIQEVTVTVMTSL